jgi:flagellar basal body-associated protein FliL
MRKKKVNNQNIEKGGSKGNFIPVLIISIISILIIVIIVLSVLYSKKNNSGTTVVVNK